MLAVAVRILFFYFIIILFERGSEMEAAPSTIRGLINDLTRTLTGSLVHMDDLLLRLDNDSGEFDDAWLANNQLERALEFFIELRSEYMIRQESVNQKKTKSYKLTAVEKLLHNFNNLLAVVVGYCDIIQDNSTDVPHICQSTSRIYKSIQKSHHFIDETICLSDRNVFLNRLTLSGRRIRQSSTEPKEKFIKNNRILLVEDDQGIKDFITMVLRKHKYIVVGCSNGEKALAKFEQSKDSFDLYIVDVGLPDIEGPDLVKKFLLEKPNINILFTSGYNETKLKEHFALIGLHQILIKPFRLEELLNKVRSIIF
jgi:PleD family two-component response regulator